MYQPFNETIPLWSLENDLHLHLKMELRFTNKNDKLRQLVNSPFNLKCILNLTLK